MLSRKIDYESIDVRAVKRIVDKNTSKINTTQTRKMTSRKTTKSKFQFDLSPIFRLNFGHGTGPALLRRTLVEEGMIEFDPGYHEQNQWSLWWKGFRFRDDEIEALSSTQRVNHHPTPIGSQGDITKKDGLLRALRNMCAIYPKCASLIRIPVTFNLPREESQFVSLFCQNALQDNDRDKNSSDGVHKSHLECSLCVANCCSTYAHMLLTNSKSHPNVWIIKPTDMSRGRGIHLFNRLEEFIYTTESVVQQYITNPLLIEGYKFDLRLYAVVPSYAPFIVYIFADGLVRFATEKFDLASLHNVYSHLTNSSINVKGPGYLAEKQGIGRGCKWSLKQFRRWMFERGLDGELMWQRVKVIIILTLLAQAMNTQKIPNAFELFGFDILIDANLQPWLIEVNANPSLSNDCVVDELVKKPLVSSIVQMLRLTEPPVEATRLVSKSIRLNKNYNNVKRKRKFIEKSRETSCGNVQLSSDSSVFESDLSDTGSSMRSYDCQDTQRSDSERTLCEDLNTVSLQRDAVKDYTIEQREYTSTLKAETIYHDSYPLYGPGSQALLPQLLALRKRYDERKPFAGDFISQNLTLNNQNFNKTNRAKHNATADSAKSGSKDNGSLLIPHSFGRLKLAFPFNLQTRIACCKEAKGYPDQKLILRQLHRLIQCYTDHNASPKDSMDIPDVWGENF